MSPRGSTLTPRTWPSLQAPGVYNSLTEVNSGSLYGLTALHQLHLGNNSISRIHRDGWSFCQKLHEL